MHNTNRFYKNGKTVSHRAILTSGLRTVRTLVAGFAICAFAACGNGDSNEARVRVFHASPDAPNVDVLIDDGRVLENVPYKAASDFLPIDAGDRRIRINVAGTDTSAIDTHAVFAEDSDYVVVALNKVAAIEPLVLDSERSSPVADKAKVRVLHAAASAPLVDIYVTAPGTDIADTNATLSGVPFKAASDYLAIPGGTYDVYVTLAGTKKTAIQAKGLVVANGMVATVAALDKVGGGAPFSLEVLVEN